MRSWDSLEQQGFSDVDHAYNYSLLVLATFCGFRVSEILSDLRCCAFFPNSLRQVDLQFDDFMELDVFL